MKNQKSLSFMIMGIVDNLMIKEGQCERCHKSETTCARLTLFGDFYQSTSPFLEVEANTLIMNEVKRQQKGKFVPFAGIRICHNCLCKSITIHEKHLSPILITQYLLVPNTIKRIILHILSEDGIHGKWKAGFGLQNIGDTRTIQQIYKDINAKKPQNLGNSQVMFV